MSHASDQAEIATRIHELNARIEALQRAVGLSPPEQIRLKLRLTDELALLMKLASLASGTDTVSNDLSMTVSAASKR